MTWLALPLYASAQGLSNAQIGTLFALPVLAQVPLNLAGGAYTDRIGGRRIVLGSCGAMALAGLWLMFAQGFWMLMLGQLALVLSRAAFWLMPSSSRSSVLRMSPGWGFFSLSVIMLQPFHYYSFQ